MIASISSNISDFFGFRHFKLGCFRPLCCHKRKHEYNFLHCFRILFASTWKILLTPFYFALSPRRWRILYWIIHPPVRTKLDANG